MRGRYTAFGFILLANIMLLVHSLVSHHHHKGIVCFTQNQTEEICCNDAQHQHNKGCDDSHSDDSACCVVKQDFLIPSDEIGKTTRCVVSEIHSKIQIWFVALLTSNIELKLFSNSKFKHQFFDDFPLNSYYLSSSLSLRAPPFI